MGEGSTLIGPDQIPDWFVSAVVFIFGSIVGSFLNVCIYRMPRNESIVRPRSHCPHCGKMISWHHNIPLFSYIALRGRTQCCGKPFSIRYWIIELVTASFFLLLWNSFQPLVAISYMIFVSLMIVATATDLEHYIIPDEITYGGIIVGLICSTLVPELQGETSHLRAFGMSLAGALTAWLVLWGIVELGKLAFGKRKASFPEPTQVTVTALELSTPTENLPWEDILMRASDRLTFIGQNILFAPAGGGATRSWESATVSVTQEGVVIAEEKFSFEGIASVKAVTAELVIPREAMGFGDVKFIGGIGAFLGPTSLFFVILVSSIAGSIIGFFLMATGKREWGGKLPYGPYLAFAAVLWMFFGPDLVDYYRNLLMPPAPPY
jgi:leader peptidase (prepilin peptidase) / N-methyltransferase